MTEIQQKISVAIADDHVLVRTAIAQLINTFEEFRVVHEASNGRDLLKQIEESNRPAIVLLDLNMPLMNGQETAERLQEEFPEIHVLLLSEYDSELTMIRLLQRGVKGFLKKDIHSNELKFALQTVMQTGYYYSNHTTGKLVNLFRNGHTGNINLQKAMLSDQELRFLQLACSDKTYKEVAGLMHMNVRAIDTLRDQLFFKLDVQSRVGMVMVAMKHGIHIY